MKRLAAAWFFAALAASASAYAGWAITGDVEHFRWSESGDPSVTETGPMFGIGARFTQDRPAGWQFGWRGRLYFGSVDYNGAFLDTGAPATGSTDYRGVVNEAQMLYRLADNPYGLELLSGLIIDYWERQLTSFQSETYTLAALRLGINADRRQDTGWFGGAGAKYPFYVRQDAHLTDLGFSSNPPLKPKGAWSLYADAGYRFSPKWSLTGYYDSYRFKESDPTPFLINPFSAGCTGVPPDPPQGCQLFQPASRVDSFGLRLQYSFQ
jgi:hypothetical protein